MLSLASFLPFPSGWGVALTALNLYYVHLFLTTKLLSWCWAPVLKMEKEPEGEPQGLRAVIEKSSALTGNGRRPQRCFLSKTRAWTPQTFKEKKLQNTVFAPKALPLLHVVMLQAKGSGPCVQKGLV